MADVPSTVQDLKADLSELQTDVRVLKAATASGAHDLHGLEGGVEDHTRQLRSLGSHAA